MSRNDWPLPKPGNPLQFDRALQPINGEPMLKREEMAALVYKLMDDKTAVSTREQLNDWYGTAFAAGMAGIAATGVAAASTATAAAAAGELGAGGAGFGSANAGMAARVTMGVVNAAPVLGLISMPLLLTGDSTPTPWHQNNIGKAAFEIVDRIPASMWTAGVATQMDLRPALTEISDKSWSNYLIKEQDKVAKTMATSIAKLLHGGSADAPGYTPQQIDAYVKNSVDAWKSKPSIVGLSPTVQAADAVRQYTAANNKPVSTTPTTSTNNEPITTTSLAPTTTTLSPSTTSTSTVPPTTTTIASPTGTTTATSSTMPPTTTPATTPPTAPPATTPSGGTNSMDFDPNANLETDTGVSPVQNRDSMLRAFRGSQSRDVTDFARQNVGTDAAPKFFGDEFTVNIDSKPLSVYDALSFLYTRSNAEVQNWEDRMIKAGVYDNLPQNLIPQMDGNAHDPANIAGWDWLLSQAALRNMGVDEVLTDLEVRHKAELTSSGMLPTFIEAPGLSQGRPNYNSAGHVMHYDATGKVVTTSADLTSPADIIQYGNRASQSLSNTDLTTEQSNALSNLIWDMQMAYDPRTAPSADGKLQAFDHQSAIYSVLSSARSGGGIYKQLDDSLAAIKASGGTP